MIGALALRSRSRRRGFNLGLAAGLALPIALLLVLSLVPRGGSSAPSVPAEIAEQRKALAAFEEGLAPIIEAGAATVVYGMRPGINDIYDARFDDETLVAMAEGWVEATRAIRADFAEIPVAPFLAETADLFRQAFHAYADTARALLAAAHGGADERVELVQRAAEHGTRADALYDAAKSRLNELSRRLGE